MLAQHPLTVIALFVAVVSIIMSSFALWPQCRGKFEVVRDAMLWIAVAVVFIGLLNSPRHGDIPIHKRDESGYLRSDSITGLRVPWNNEYLSSRNHDDSYPSVPLVGRSRWNAQSAWSDSWKTGSPQVLQSGFEPRPAFPDARTDSYQPYLYP